MLQLFLLSPWVGEYGIDGIGLQLEGEGLKGPEWHLIHTEGSLCIK